MGAFDLILANPPFKGSLDEQDVAADILRTVKTKKTELLFIALILRMLKTWWAAAPPSCQMVCCSEQARLMCSYASI
jgi:type I restriction-modification system DNA methylase subunit